MSWVSWPFRIAGFTAWYVIELVRSNVTVLKDNLTPGQDSRPGVARVDTRCRSDLELTLLAALITLTPGTLTLGVSATEHGRTLYVHALYAGSPEAVRAQVERLETKLLRAARRKGEAG